MKETKPQKAHLNGEWQFSYLIYICSNDDRLGCLCRCFYPQVALTAYVTTPRVLRQWLLLNHQTLLHQDPGSWRDYWDLESWLPCHYSSEIIIGKEVNQQTLTDLARVKPVLFFKWKLNIVKWVTLQHTPEQLLCQILKNERLCLMYG